MRLQVQSLASLSGLRIHVAMNCGVGHRRGLDLALLWLWCGLAVATPIPTRVWELPYAMGVALTKKINK